jgi:hypothetical protein
VFANVTYRRTAFRFGMGSAAVTLLLSMTAVSTANGGESSHSVKQRTLISMVASAPAGFSSDRVDQDSGGPTGRIDFDGASSADCNPTAMSRSIWVASVLRFYDNNPTESGAYVLICLTQFRTTNDANVNRTRVAALRPSRHLASAHEPNVYLETVGPAQQIFFSRGKYFVWIVSVDLSSTAKALALGSNLAHREFLLLPN